jgi:hypothetical protein
MHLLVTQMTRWRLSASNEYFAASWGPTTQGASPDEML